MLQWGVLPENNQLSHGVEIYIYLTNLLHRLTKLSRRVGSRPPMAIIGRKTLKSLQIRPFSTSIFWLFWGVIFWFFSSEINFNAFWMWICGSLCRAMRFSWVNDREPRWSKSTQGWQLQPAELPKIANSTHLNLKIGSKKSRQALEILGN